MGDRTRLAIASQVDQHDVEFQQVSVEYSVDECDVEQLLSASGRLSEELGLKLKQGLEAALDSNESPVVQLRSSEHRRDPGGEVNILGQS